MKNNIAFFEKPKENEPWDVAIIGSGPAGLTAAIYTTRGAASTIIFAGDVWGGQLMLTTDVDNFPGFPQGIQGPDLMREMRLQAERFGAEIVNENVNQIDFTKRPFELFINSEKYLAKTIIIASGAETKWLGVPGEDKLRGRGVSSCAPCDAPFFKNKKVAVIGGGDAAMEETLVLTKHASEVTIIHRRNEFRASRVMQKKVFDNKKIKIIWDSEVVEFLGDHKLEYLKIKNVKTGKVEKIDVDGAFVAIGHNPSTNIFTGKIDLDEKGYIRKMENSYKMATNVDGVFVAGDVHDYHYRQAVTAAGYGCMAGLDALKYLEEKDQSN
ncbi:thioredoxin-disulfide reductase [Candidatus Woesebacteria bacterium RBG_16_34_12]|uniref:Thioredoxin reductase n=1 Tax=Candidatus Woesebacteria bacterium RBG_16_34_12 TaxID=1802480 RepID=A0A1F7XAR1_9BACT|nr:MAG: thioredoxin-disulfide reductase [Candidatus Woesebacteria bacterium RBG_16_34_12]